MTRFPDRDTPGTRPDVPRPLAARQTGHRDELADRGGQENAPSRRSFQDRLQGSLVDVAIHRAVASRDLVAQQFDGHRFVGRRGIDSLKNAGLVNEHTIQDPATGRDTRVLTATPAGRQLATRVSLERGYDQGQRTWAGIGKRADLKHDLALYRAVALARAQLAERGLHVRRLRLDAEMRSLVAKRTEAVRADRGRAAADALRQELAQRLHLPLDENGAILYPDAQLEYAREPDGPGVGRVNLEITTEHYSRASIAAKSAAGFALFPSGAKAGRHLAGVLHALSSQSGDSNGSRGGRGRAVEDGLLEL